MIQLTCAVGVTDPAQAGARFADYLPLFRLIANSIVIHNRARAEGPAVRAPAAR